MCTRNKLCKEKIFVFGETVNNRIEVKVIKNQEGSAKGRKKS